MGFETGMALGQQIGSAMGAQSSEFAESLVKQKFASDMNLRSSTLAHASKNGLGVNVGEDGVSLNPYIYGGAPDQVKALAISQYRKQEQEAMEKQSEATIKQLKTVNELFSQFDKHKDSPGLRKAYGNMINEVVSKPEINGAPNPLRWVGKLLSEDGQFDMLQVMAGNQNYKDLKTQAALLVHQGFVDASREGNLPTMREHLSVLRGMSADDPELMKNMGIDVSKSFSEYQQAFETQAEKAAREMREAERKSLAQTRGTEAAKGQYGGSAQNWMLPDGTVVSSFDKGRTYIDESGKQKPIPTVGSYKVQPATATDVRAMKAQKAAREELKDIPKQKREDFRQAARQGAGPYAMLAAGLDAVAGGLGADALLGKDGFFKDTQESRQALRFLKQTSKEALMNSARGAIWEQERIEQLFPNPDAFFRSPATEARKLGTLVKLAKQRKAENLREMQSAVDPKVIQDLGKFNAGLDVLIRAIGEQPQRTETTVSPDDEALINKYLKEGQ